MARRKQQERPTYTIHIDKNWSLQDLYEFPRAYEQVYFVMYSLMSNDGDQDYQRIEHVYSRYPWRGGYSAVNFFNQLKYIVAVRSRPTIKSIQYASPGWIELALAVSVALNVEKLVKCVCSSIRECNSTYGDIVKGMQQRKILRLKTEQEFIKLQKADMAYVISSSKKMQAAMGLDSHLQIDRLSKHPYLSLKILLAIYRRVRILAEYQSKGKADFDNDR